MWYAVLVLVMVAGLVLVPLGLPGLWLMVAGAIGYHLLVLPSGIGWPAIGVSLALAGVAEVLEFTLSVKYTKKYGGSKRAGWGALAGGLIGAVIGAPIPIIGSVVAAFAGSFFGALLAEYSVAKDRSAAGRAAWGSLIGRVFATFAKTAIALAIAVIVLVRAWPR